MTISRKLCEAFTVAVSLLGGFLPSPNEIHAQLDLQNTHLYCRKVLGRFCSILWVFVHPHCEAPSNEF